MVAQLRLTDYVSNFQAALSGLMTPTPVYNTYNPNYANEPKFLVWFYRNVHQPVYTGSFQGNKGNDQPKFDIHCHAQTLAMASALADQILQAWHGYTGLINTLYVSKIDVTVLAHTYDEEVSLHQVALSLDFYVPVSST